MTATGIIWQAVPALRGAWARRTLPTPPSSAPPKWNRPRDKPGRRAETRKPEDQPCPNSKCPGAPRTRPGSAAATAVFSSFVVGRFGGVEFDFAFFVTGHALVLGI